MLDPLELLYDTPGLPTIPLPPALEEFYGPLALGETSLFANFVSTVDGVVALPWERRSNRLISDDSESDRCVMGLLRACADVVLVGSGTLTASPGSTWSPEQAYPPAGADYAELRRMLGLPPEPEVAVLTASGAIDPGHPALAAGAIVLTTEQGAELLGDVLPRRSRLVALPGEELVDVSAAIEFLRADGLGRILSEAGPAVFGSLLADGLVDELFLTLSPLVAGRSAEHEPYDLVEGTSFLPGRRVAWSLVSVRREGEHLFLRYGIVR